MKKVSDTNSIIPSLDYILLTHCGGMGKWQLKNSFFVLLIYYASLYPLFLTVFSTYAPEHRCYIEASITLFASDYSLYIHCVTLIPEQMLSYGVKWGQGCLLGLILSNISMIRRP